MAKITAPNRQYSGLVAGVRLVDGQGETDDQHAINYFRRAAYTVTDGAEPAGGTQDGEFALAVSELAVSRAFGKATVPVLKKFADANGIELVDDDGAAVTRKGDIVAVIEAALATTPGDQGDDEDPEA